MRLFIISVIAVIFFLVATTAIIYYNISIFKNPLFSIRIYNLCINVPLFSKFDITLITNDGKSEKCMDKPVSHSSKSMITMVTEMNSVHVDTIFLQKES